MPIVSQCCQVYGFIRILRIYELNTDLRTDKSSYLYFYGFLQDATYIYTMVQVTHCHNARPVMVVFISSNPECSLVIHNHIRPLTLSAMGVFWRSKGVLCDM